jgi:hypothetical protein
MSRWRIRIGVFCLVLGILLASPLTDLMPVNGFSFTVASAHYRVIPADNGLDHASIALAAAGCLLLCAGLITKRRAQ